MQAAAVQHELARLLGQGAVRAPAPHDLRDATELRGLAGHAEAVVAPATADDVATLLAWCYRHDVPLVPRGGGSGFAGGAVPLGGVVCRLERLQRIRSLDPGRWRMEVEAGVTTAEVRRRAREVGLRFPPDPGAGEQSQIGGNIATNAGGPHAFKYGVTGAWVTGLEAVVPPGEVVRLGGPVRKDVAGYDLRSLLVGSEGTLGIITAAWLRLVPAAEAAYPIVASYADVGAGCGALDEVLGSGVHPAAIEYLDAGALRAASRRFPGGLVPGAAFALVVETDGAEAAARAERDLLLEILAPAALACHAPTSREDTAALWRWREGVSLAVAAVRGGKLSEDVAVPVERLREAIEETVAIGARHGVEACSWGHAGDGNLHATFLVGATDRAGLERSEAAARELFGLALRLGGTVSGEHGLGLVKGGQLRRAWEPRAVGLHEAVKRAFDPKGLLNPGKKLA